MELNTNQYVRDLMLLAERNRIYLPCNIVGFQRSSEKLYYEDIVNEAMKNNCKFQWYSPYPLNSAADILDPEKKNGICVTKKARELAEKIYSLQYLILRMDELVFEKLRDTHS